VACDRRQHYQGGKLDKAKAKALKVYGNGHAAKGIPHFAFTTEATILQVHGFGPQALTYVNPAHDPRQQQD